MQAIATRGRLAAAASPTIRFFASRPAAARGSLPSWRAASRLPDVASPPLPTGEPSCHAGPAHGSSCDVPPSRVPQLMRAVRGLGCTLRKMAPGLMALAVVAATSLALPSSATAAAVGAHEPSNPLSGT